MFDLWIKDYWNRKYKDAKPERSFAKLEECNFKRTTVLVGWFVGSGEPCFQGRPMCFSRILMPSPYPTAGLWPETFHLDLVIPPKGDSIQVLPAVSFGSANANAELPGKGFGPPCNMCLFSSPPPQALPALPWAGTGAAPSTPGTAGESCTSTRT